MIGINKLKLNQWLLTPQALSALPRPGFVRRIVTLRLSSHLVDIAPVIGVSKDHVYAHVPICLSTVGSVAKF